MKSLSRSSLSPTEAACVAITRLGGSTQAAKVLTEMSPDDPVSRQAVDLWRLKRVPAHRVLLLEKASNVSRTLLRPDLYPIEARGKVA